MNQLPHLLAAVQRAVRLRTFVRTFATWVIVTGTFSVVLALALPSVPRWHALLGLAVALMAGLLQALTRRDGAADLVSYVDERVGAQLALVATMEGGAHTRTQAQAAQALMGKTPRDVRPVVWRGEWPAFVFAATAVVAAWVVPQPPAPRVPLAGRRSRWPPRLRLRASPRSLGRRVTMRSGPNCSAPPPRPKRCALGSSKGCRAARPWTRWGVSAKEWRRLAGPIAQSAAVRETPRPRRWRPSATWRRPWRSGTLSR